MEVIGKKVVQEEPRITRAKVERIQYIWRWYCFICQNMPDYKNEPEVIEELTS